MQSSFWTYNACFLAEFSLAELEGTPVPPLTENHSAQKPCWSEHKTRGKILRCVGLGGNIIKYWKFIPRVNPQS